MIAEQRISGKRSILCKEKLIDNHIRENALERVSPFEYYIPVRIRLVCRAIMRSSLVGMTRTVQGLSGVEITSACFLFFSASI